MIITWTRIVPEMIKVCEPVKPGSIRIIFVAACQASPAAACSAAVLNIYLWVFPPNVPHIKAFISTVCRMLNFNRHSSIWDMLENTHRQSRTHLQRQDLFLSKRCEDESWASRWPVTCSDFSYHCDSSSVSVFTSFWDQTLYKLSLKILAFNNHLFL